MLGTNGVSIEIVANIPVMFCPPKLLKKGLSNHVSEFFSACYSEHSPCAAYGNSYSQFLVK